MFKQMMEKEQIIREFQDIKKDMLRRHIKYDTELSLRVLSIQNQENKLSNITRYRTFWKILQNRIAFLSRLRRLISEARMFGLKLTKDSRIVEPQISRHTMKGLINPQGTIYQIHMMFITLLLSYLVLILPLRIAFYEEEFTKSFDFFGVIISAYLLFDLVLSFFVTFKEEGKYVLKWATVATTYIKTWFFFDLIAIVDYHLVFNINNRIGQRALLGIKYLKLFTSLLQFRNMAYRDKYHLWHSLRGRLSIHKGYGNIVFVIIITLLFTHISACLWIMLIFNENQQNSWLNT